MNADAFGGFLAQKIEGEVAQEGEIAGRVSHTDTALILTKGHIQDPMDAVLNAPVLTNGLADLAGRAVQAGEVVNAGVLLVHGLF